MEQLMSVEEAAKRLGGISKYTIHTWLSQGKLRRTKVGRRTMIRESELAKVIDDDGKSPCFRHSPAHKSGETGVAPVGSLNITQQRSNALITQQRRNARREGEV
jgi:excisionase family DNA binding protein